MRWRDHRDDRNSPADARDLHIGRRWVWIFGGLLFGIASFAVLLPSRHAAFRVEAQGGIELSCPNATFPVSGFTTYNQITGKLRQNLCMDTSGNLYEPDNRTITGTSFLSSIDSTSATMRTFQDVLNGGGPGQPAPRSAAYIFRSSPAASSDSSVVANNLFYFGGVLSANTGSTTSELHHVLFVPVISRGLGASISDKITGVSFAAPVAPTGDASTARSGITATVSVESNPPTTWCNGTSNLSANIQTALTNLGAGSCAAALNVSAGSSLFGGAINFAVAGTGINQGIGDLVIQNADSTAAGTISFYSAGSLRMRMVPSGAFNISNALRIGDQVAPNTTLDVNGIVRIEGTNQMQLGSTTNASLGTPQNGTLIYCSDCTIANPCAGAGTGALAKRLNGVWVCN